MPVSPRLLRLVPILLCLGGVFVACSDPKSIFDTPSAPTPVPNGPPIPVPVSTILDLAFEPRALSGGASGTGAAILTVPAPAGGLVVELATNDSSISVPPLVTVPAGASRGDFPVSSRTVSGDTSVSVNAAVGSRVVTRTIGIWAELPTFLSWFSDPGDWVGGGEFGRLSTGQAVFSASGGTSGVDIRATGAGAEFWNLSFAPRRGDRLQVGGYENAMRAAFRDDVSPGLDVSGRGRGCNKVAGRFDVIEADLSSSQVRKFRARFQQHCENQSVALIGEVRFTSGAR